MLPSGLGTILGCHGVLGFPRPDPDPSALASHSWPCALAVGTVGPRKAGTNQGYLGHPVLGP